MMAPHTPTTPAAASIRRHLIIALGAVALLLGGFGGWAATAGLEGAVMASGMIAVEGSVKRVQHREGGIVGDILVRDGGSVEAGQLLIRLDDTGTSAELAIIEDQLMSLTARRLRLEAERDGAADLTPPPDQDDPVLLERIASERALLVARRETVVAQVDQLRERVTQIRREVEGLTARRSARQAERAVVARELKGIKELHAKGLVPAARLNDLERSAAQIDGDLGQLTAEIARAETRITETELHILSLHQQRLTEVLAELREVEGGLAELSERRVAARDRLARLEVRAPVPGIVHELSIHTRGGVVGPGEALLTLVPVGAELVVEARVAPADVDQLHVGQTANLRLSAFNQRTTPEITGEVTTIAADLTADPQTGQSWYAVRVRIPPDQLARLGELTLMPGMPVEVFARTGQRTALSYLVKPLSDQIARAFREE